MSYSSRKWSCLLEYDNFKKGWHWQWTSCLSMAMAKGSKQSSGTWAGLESNSRQSPFNTTERSRKWLPVNTLRSSTSLYCQKKWHKDTKIAKKSTYFHKMKIPGSWRLFYFSRAESGKNEHWSQAHSNEEWGTCFWRVKVIKILAQTITGGSCFPFFYFISLGQDGWSVLIKYS